MPSMASTTMFRAPSLSTSNGIIETIPILTKVEITAGEGCPLEPPGQTRWIVIRVDPKKETFNTLKFKIWKELDDDVQNWPEYEMEYMHVTWNMDTYRSRHEDAHSHLDCVDDARIKSALELMAVRQSQDWLEVGIVVFDSSETEDGEFSSKKTGKRQNSMVNLVVEEWCTMKDEA